MKTLISPQAKYQPSCQLKSSLTDTGEKVQKWTRYFLLFFPTRPSDEYDSARGRKYSRPLLDVFACIG